MVERDYASLLNPSIVLGYVKEGVSIIAEPYQSLVYITEGLGFTAEPCQRYWAYSEKWMNLFARPYQSLLSREGGSRLMPNPTQCLS